MNSRESLVIESWSDGKIMHATSEIRLIWPISRTASVVVLFLSCKGKQFIKHICGGDLARIKDTKHIVRLLIGVLPDFHFKKLLLIASPTRNFSVIISRETNLGEVFSTTSVFGSERLLSLFLE